MTTPTKKAAKKPQTPDDTLASAAYRAYLCGRLAARIPDDTALWAALTAVHAAPSSGSVEAYCYAKGLLAADPGILNTQELLDAVHAELRPPARPRRPRRPDQRWGAK